MRRLRPVALVTLVLLALGSGCGGDGDGGGGEIRYDHDFLIPEGTGERIEAGERIDLIPARLDVKVGDMLRIVNQDDRGHLLGPFFVGPGETLTQRFATPGRFGGACSIRSDGEVTIIVTE